MHRASAPRRPRSKTPPASLSGVLDAYAAHIIDAGPTVLGATIDESKQTVHGWSTNLHRWSGVAVLILARHVPSIGAAVCAYINGTALPSAVPTNAIPLAYETASHANDLIREILAAVKSGDINRAESRRIVRWIKALAKILPQLERDVQAAAR